MPERTEYAATRTVPYLLGFGTQTLACPFRHITTGALVAPASATVKVVKSSGEEITPAPTVAIIGNQAEWPLTLATTESAGEGWTIELTPTFGTTVYPPSRFEAILCEYAISCPISTADLWGGEGVAELQHRVPQARTAAPRGDGSGWTPEVEGAYHSGIQWLIDNGHRIHEIRSILGFRKWVLTEALMRCCRHLSTASDDTWERKTTDFRYEHRAAEATMKVQYAVDSPSHRRAASPLRRLAPVGRPLW